MTAPPSCCAAGAPAAVVGAVVAAGLREVNDLEAGPGRRLAAEAAKGEGAPSLRGRLPRSDVALLALALAALAER